MKTNQGMRQNPNRSNTLKRCKEEENRPKTLRFNLLEGEKDLASSEMNESCALAEHFAGDLRGRGRS